MLELILALVLPLGATETRGRVRATLGGTYDSNILIAPDSMFDQGRPSNYGDYRLVTNADATYRAFEEGPHRVSVEGGAFFTNTVQNAHAAGDPYRVLILAPYAYTRAGPAPYRLTARPGAQILYMDPTLTARKNLVQESALIDGEAQWRQGPRFESTVTLQYRRDKSKLLASIGDFNADANKFTARARETFFIDRRHALSGEVAVVSNQAVGRFARYDRVEGGLTFTGPLFGPVTFLAAASYYRLNFPTSDVPRRDGNLSARFKARWPLDPAWAVELDGIYARNAGLAAPFRYQRWVTMASLTASLDW